MIENVIPDIDHRHQGIDTVLLEDATKRAFEHDCYKVMLMSGRAEERVNDFYQSCGFGPDQKQAYIKRAVL